MSEGFNFEKTTPTDALVGVFGAIARWIFQEEVKLCMFPFSKKEKK